jgi:hypothetical protein
MECAPPESREIPFSKDAVLEMMKLFRLALSKKFIGNFPELK